MPSEKTCVKRRPAVLAYPFYRQHDGPEPCLCVLVEVVVTPSHILHRCQGQYPLSQRYFARCCKDFAVEAPATRAPYILATILSLHFRGALSMRLNRSLDPQKSCFDHEDHLIGVSHSVRHRHPVVVQGERRETGQNHWRELGDRLDAVFTFWPTSTRLRAAPTMRQGARS